MADLYVDGDGLSSLADSLDSIRDAMGERRTRMSSVRGDVGSGKVADALEHFDDHWEDGREKVDKSAESLSSMLRTSLATFRDTDEQLKKDLQTTGSS